MTSRARTIIWILVTIVLAAAMYATARSKRDFVDFEVYRVAAVRALDAEPLYRSEDGHYQYKYWPAFAFAMAPFAPLHPEVGKVVWFALSVTLLILFVRWSIAALPDRRRSTAVLAWITALLIGKYVVKELVNGQTNVLLGVLLVLALMAAQRGHQIRAGVLVGAAIFVKPYAILLLPWLAVSIGLSATAAAGAVLAAGLLAPALVYGWGGNLDQLLGWYHTVTSTTPENLLLAENISFATMWAKWLGPGQTASTLALVTSAAALSVGVVVWLQRRRVAHPGFLEVALLLLLIPVLSPQGWDYVLILGTPAIALLLDRWSQLSTPWKLIAASGLALTSFTVFDLLGRSLYTYAMAWSIQTVAVLALLACLASLRWHRLA